MEGSMGPAQHMPFLYYSARPPPTLLALHSTTTTPTTTPTQTSPSPSLLPPSSRNAVEIIEPAMLQSQLHDVSSDSIPLLLLAVVARSVHHLRSLLLALLHPLRLSRSAHRPSSDPADAALIGSGLAGLIVLADHLNQNRLSSRRCCAPAGRPDCVVCLSALREGELVRELGCRHVFHKACLDGWLQHLNFSCPLCRSPLASGEPADAAERRVGGELVEWLR